MTANAMVNHFNRVILCDYIPMLSHEANPRNSITLGLALGK